MSGNENGGAERIADMGVSKTGCMEDGSVSSHDKVDFHRYVQVSFDALEWVVAGASGAKQI